MSESTSYSPPFFLFNAHLETIFPALFRNVTIHGYTRERINTPDNDFLDLDWLTQDSNKLVIIQHGLEGDSARPYIKGMAKAFYANGYDVLAWNYRGCSGEVNRQLRFYHSGASDDLHTVIEHAILRKPEREIYLVGFSLGGNITLKYLGERTISASIKKAIVFSVPLHLESSCKKISTPSNRIYSRRFVRSLKEKIRRKSRIMPGLEVHKLPTIKTLLEFDETFTAPLHGFKNAIDYYNTCSAVNFISNIKIPTLIVNTKNDPFLADECFPRTIVQGHTFVKLEIPERGGHVGFALIKNKGLYWSEQRALEWMAN